MLCCNSSHPYIYYIYYPSTSWLISAQFERKKKALNKVKVKQIAFHRVTLDTLLTVSPLSHGVTANPVV